MNNTPCYPTSHIPIYVIIIIFLALMFFAIYWQSTEQRYYRYYENNRHLEQFSQNVYYPPIQAQNQNQNQNSNSNQNPDPLWTPNTITVGQHNSSHGSPTIAAPYVSPSTYQKKIFPYE